MQITVTIPDSQWKQFQELAQGTVETTWNDSYEDFATYIMLVNIDTYIESQKRKQAKKLKHALASYEAQDAQRQDVEEAKFDDVLPLPVKEKALEVKVVDVAMTDKEISARIEKLQTVPVKRRTLEQTNELNELFDRRKKQRGQ